MTVETKRMAISGLLSTLYLILQRQKLEKIEKKKKRRKKEEKKPKYTQGLCQRTN